MSAPVELAVAIAGALAGLGLAIAVLAVSGASLTDAPPVATSSIGLAGPRVRRLMPTDAVGRAMIGAGVIAGVSAATVVRVPAIAVIVAGAVLLGVVESRAPSVAAQNVRGAAIAAWCESVRHALEAGQPERAALLAACDDPPPGLEQPLRRLAAALESESVSQALRAFASEVRHPAAGNVVAALDVAYRFGAGNLPALMAGQVESTRNQVQALRELHAARAKHRRAMLLLLGLFLVVISGLFLVWPDFLAAYRGVQGQAVLLGIGLAVLGSVRALIRLGRPQPAPDFFTAGPDDVRLATTPSEART